MCGLKSAGFPSNCMYGNKTAHVTLKNMVCHVDLHVHSTASDGTDDPADLVSMAARLGLAAIALTDHDTIAGLEEAEEAAARLQVGFIRGCELAASSEYGEVHILGLWLPRDMPVLTLALEEWRKRRDSRNALIVENLRRNGFPIEYREVEDVAKGESVGRLHIARALAGKGLVPSIQAAFDTLLGDDKPMHVPRELPTPKEVVQLLRSEGASVVFAHPMLLRAPMEWLNDCIADLCPFGLDAIEAYHSDHDQEDVRCCVRLAGKHGLALSGGSDYHGLARADVRLGAGAHGMKLPWHLVETLQKQRKRNGLPVVA